MTIAPVFVVACSVAQGACISVKIFDMIFYLSMINLFHVGWFDEIKEEEEEKKASEKYGTHLILFGSPHLILYPLIRCSSRYYYSQTADLIPDLLRFLSQLNYASSSAVSPKWAALYACAFVSLANKNHATIFFPLNILQIESHPVFFRNSNWCFTHKKNETQNTGLPIQMTILFSISRPPHLCYS